jgi:hypothetical protein
MRSSTKLVKLVRHFPEKLYREFNRTVLSYIQQNIATVIDIDSDETFGALIAYQYAVSAQISKEAQNSFPAIEDEPAKIAARHILSRQDANAAR